MAIFSSLAGFIKRHKRKILWASGLSVSAYLLVNHFIIKRIRDFQNSLKQELFVKEQIRRRFIQTQNDCYLTILALLPVLTHPITSHLPIELITQALKMKKNTPAPEMSDSMLTTDNLLLHSNPALELSTESIYLNKSKVELWNDLKIKTLTRSLTLIYSISALLLITRLQLNILARRSYLELAIVMAGGKPPASELSEHEEYVIEQSYLSLSWWLLNKGWLRISDIIESLVTKHFKHINAKTELTVARFSEIVAAINADVLAGHHEELVNLVFPLHYDSLVESLMNTNPDTVHELDVKDSNFVKLVNETNLLVTNEYFARVFTTMVTTSAETLSQNLSLALDPENYLLNQNAQVVELSDRKFKLASMLAQLLIQCGVMCDNNNLAEYVESELLGNVYVNNLNELEDLDEFSASIYSNFE